MALGFVMGVGATCLACCVLFVVLARFERQERDEAKGLDLAPAPVISLSDFRDLERNDAWPPARRSSEGRGFNHNPEGGAAA